MAEVKTYTITYDEVQKSIIIPAVLEHNNRAAKVRALVDTGAVASYVMQWVVDGLDFPETGNIYQVKFGEDEAIRSSVVANLILSSDVSFTNKEFTVLKDSNRDYDAIIGMNILSRTDFSISNYNGHTVFSFQLPSQEEIKYGDAFDHETDVKNIMDNIEDQLLSTQFILTLLTA